MIKTSFLQRASLLFVTAGVSLGLAGCSKEPAPSTPDEVKAFAGDPALKAKQGEAYRAKAMANMEAGQAAAKAKSVPPPRAK